MSQRNKRSWSRNGFHVINHQNDNFNKFQYGKFWFSQSATNKLKSNVEFGYIMCSLGNSGPPAVTLTKWLKWSVHARYINILSVTVSTFKRRMEKKLLGERREKWGAMHRLVVSFLGLFYSDIRRAYAFVLYGRRGRVWWSPQRKFGRICAELRYSEPTWTKNSAYRTVPFLDFWVLEWYWNYKWLFWKLMKGIGCWIVSCIPSECFELTQKLFK